MYSMSTLFSIYVWILTKIKVYINHNLMMVLIYDFFQTPMKYLSAVYLIICLFVCF